MQSKSVTVMQENFLIDANMIDLDPPVVTFSEMDQKGTWLLLTKL